MANFAIYDNNNFHMRFTNGYTLSIGIGHFHGCDNRRWEKPIDAPSVASENCEVAVYKNGNFISGWPGCNAYDIVGGYRTPEDVQQIIQWIMAQP